MVAISVGTYFTLNYVEYLLIDVDGQPVSDLIDFTGYMSLILTNMSMSMTRGGGETGALGNVGYVVALLQITGFAGGGFGAFMFLKEKPFCGPCDKYYKRAWKDTRFSGAQDNDQFLEGIRSIASAFDGGDVAGARDRHSSIGAPKPSKQTHLRTTLTLDRCPECERQLLVFETSKQKGNDWEAIRELSFSNLYAGAKDAAAPQPN